MSEADELIYSDEASAARCMLYQDINDINIIVEDKGKEFEYETIFKRLLKDEYHIYTIFAIGGKKNVYSFYQECREKKDVRNNVYIVDGDFDRYTNPDEMVRDPCFIYLEAYNIENYFVDKRACEQFAKGLLKCLEKDVERKIIVARLSRPKSINF